jgi:5-methylcytosine-specific restriction endonuclease McrA
MALVYVGPTRRLRAIERIQAEGQPDRRSEAARLRAEGLSLRAIAARLDCSTATIRRDLSTSGRLWVAGCCRRCSDPFVIVDQTESAYCSTSCGRADGKDRRRAKQKAATGQQRVYRRRIFERDGWRCQLCRKKVKRTAKVPHPLAPTLDHVVPLALGGRHEPANVQLAHFICNAEKKAGVYGVGEQLRLVG